VVVFERGEAKKVVHRVVKKYSTGVRTWGDNNSHIDPGILEASDIKGRVTGFLLRIKTRIDAEVSKRLHSFYHRILKSGILTRFLSIRIISFNRDDGVETQLLWRGKVIGRCLAGDKEWKIKDLTSCLWMLRPCLRNNYV